MDKSRPLLTLDEALALTASQVVENHKTYGNSGLTSLLSLLGLDRKFVRAQGNYVWDDSGNRYIDFLAGYGSVSLGHNHPRVVEAVHKVDDLPNILQVSLPTMSGALARNLAAICPGELQRTFFGNSGTEAVEGALKLARAATGKIGFVYADNSFHGKTFGSLSVTGREKYQKTFMPLVPGASGVPFGDASALEKALRAGNVAAFIVEPIQGEGGVNVPPTGYLSEAKRLCARYGALLIVDEIQTGLGRTGKMFACEYDDVAPDVMCLAKSLGGGVMPIGAFVTTDDIWQKAFGGPNKSTLHTSTFGGNTRACAAGIAALQVITEEKLAQAAAEKGAYLMEKLKTLQQKHDSIKEVRGKGLLIGLEFKEPTSGVLKALSFGVVNALSREYLGAMVSGELATKHHLITAYTLNNPNVIRLEPPLTITTEDIDYTVSALDDVLGRFRSIVSAMIGSAGGIAGSMFGRKKD
jgi:putrescine aminotransferase